MRVLKVGGTSVDSAERMRGVAEIVVGRAREGSPLLVVVSAVGGMTALDAAARPATLDALEGELATAGLVDPVFVDCTADDGVSSWYGLAFEPGSTS